MTGSVDAAPAVGRCYGALFFCFFGAAWFVLAAYAFGGLTGLEMVGIAGALTLLVNQAIRLLRRGKDAAKNAFPEEEQKRNDRIFGIVNAVTWVSVFLVFQIFPRFGLGELTVPAVVLIVGLHFFPMPPLVPTPFQSGYRRSDGDVGNFLRGGFSWRQNDRLCRSGCWSSVVGVSYMGA